MSRIFLFVKRYSSLNKTDVNRKFFDPKSTDGARFFFKSKNQRKFFQ